LYAEKILREAQNALLKLFEEPSEQTFFYLIIPNKELLLPTLLSRLHIVDTQKISPNESIFDSFLSLSPSEKLATIEKKLKEEDFEWMNQIMSGFEVYAEQSKDAQIVSTAILLSRYANNKGASKKMLLEHLALSL
jgi:DNA polymerase III delta prime subunit